jgi:hypothetical protein
LLPFIYQFFGLTVDLNALIPLFHKTLSLSKYCICADSSGFFLLRKNLSTSAYISR